MKNGKPQDLSVYPYQLPLQNDYKENKKLSQRYNQQYHKMINSVETNMEKNQQEIKWRNNWRFKIEPNKQTSALTIINFFTNSFRLYYKATLKLVNLDALTTMQKYAFINKFDGLSNTLSQNLHLSIMTFHHPMHSFQFLMH